MKHLLVLFALVSTPALAQVEIRAQYNQIQSKPTTFNTEMQDYVKDGPGVGQITGYGADALITPPLMPVVFGVRYEMLGYKGSGAGTISGTAVNTDVKVSGSRTMALAGLRLISLPVGHVGVLAHYGLSQALKYTKASTNAGGTTVTDTFTGEMDQSYGAGVEAAFKLGYLTVGAEVGYTKLKAKSFTDSNGTLMDLHGNVVSMDLSGTYAKALVGVKY